MAGHRLPSPHILWLLSLLGPEKLNSSNYSSFKLFFQLELFKVHFNCTIYRVKDWQIEMCFATLAGRHAANHLCSIFDGLSAMKRSLLSGESLANNARVLGQDQVLPGRIVRASEPHWRQSKTIWKNNESWMNNQRIIHGQWQTEFWTMDLHAFAMQLWQSFTSVHLCSVITPPRPMNREIGPYSNYNHHWLHNLTSSPRNLAASAITCDSSGQYSRCGSHCTWN